MDHEDELMLYDDEYSELDNCSVETSGKLTGTRSFPGMNLLKNGKLKSSGHFIEHEPGHYVIFRNVNRKRIPVEVYMTKNQPGYLIRNANSGIRETKYRVGRRDECLFFKVKLLDKYYGQRESYGVLFYDSPEEYERHFHLTLDQEIKEKWLEQKTQYMQELRGDDASEDKPHDMMVIVH
jgi:hypothetical protein